MTHPPLYDVTGFETVGDYVLRVSFDDGTVQTIDFEPVLHGPVFSPLRDLDLFKQVCLDPEAGTLVWPNGATFDPTNLHDWPEDGPAFVEKVRDWRRAHPAPAN